MPDLGNVEIMQFLDHVKDKIKNLKRKYRQRLNKKNAIKTPIH